MSEIRVNGATVALRPQGASAGGAVATPTNAWLLELERARWMAQPRYHGSGSEDASMAAEIASVGEADANGMPHQAGPQVTWSADHDGRPAPVIASAGEAADVSVVSTPGPDTPAREALLAGAGTPAVVRARAADAAISALRSAPSTATNVQWSARSVHVHVGEQATSVWVRDARLMPQDAVRLLEQLRPLLAHRQLAGAPVQLTVNGKPVEPQLQETSNAG